MQTIKAGENEFFRFLQFSCSFESSTRSNEEFLVSNFILGGAGFEGRKTQQYSWTDFNIIINDDNTIFLNLYLYNIFYLDGVTCRLGLLMTSLVNPKVSLSLEIQTTSTPLKKNQSKILVQ